MELDDFKNTWDSTGNRLPGEQELSIQSFTAINKRNFRSRLKRIVLPELAGSAVSVASAVYIACNFFRLGTLFFQSAGAITILLLLVLPVISVASIQPMYKAGNINSSYADTLKTFATQKIRFCKLQKLNITLSYLLLVTMILILPDLFGRNYITGSRYFFVFAFPIGYIVLLCFSGWVFKSYNKTIRHTEDLLKELAS